MILRYCKPMVLMIIVGAVLCAVTLAKMSGQNEQSSAASVGETERSITVAEVPAPALATLKKLAGGAEFTEFSEEIEHGQTFYEGSWKKPSGKNVDALVTPAGDLVEIEEEVAADDVPVAVLKAAQAAAGNDPNLAFEKKTMFLYEAKFRKGERGQELLMTPDGRKVEEEAEKGKKDNEDKDENEKKVSLNELPDAVKAAILKEAEGGTIKKIESDTENGKTIYEAEVVINEKTVEIKVAADGTLLSKEAEEDNDEADKNNEDNESDKDD